MELPRGVVLERMASGDGVVIAIPAVELPAGVGVVMVSDERRR